MKTARKFNNELVRSETSLPVLLTLLVVPGVFTLLMRYVPIFHQYTHFEYPGIALLINVLAVITSYCHGRSKDPSTSNLRFLDTFLYCGLLVWWMTQVDVPFSYAFALIYIQAAAFYGRLEASVGLALSIALPGIAGAAWQCVYGHLEFCIFVGFALVLFYFSTNQLRRSREVESLRHSLSTTTRVADQSMDLAFAALASEFGAMIHDLANYLMAMRTFNDILEIEDVLQDKELKLLLSDAKKSMEATCEIINHFKLKIKNRSNASNPNVTFSLRPIVESAIKTNKWYRRIAIQTEIHHDATINGYDEYLETILRNLINNAGEAGAKNIRVTTRLITGGSNLLLQISDDGPGISAEIRGKLFNEMVTWGKAHGNGMGIYMCRRLAQLLQADLMIESSTTQGTIFIIKFNLAGNRVGTA